MPKKNVPEDESGHQPGHEKRICMYVSKRGDRDPMTMPKMIRKMIGVDVTFFF